MSSPPTRQSVPHPRRVVPKVAEVWDEDFEFPTVAIPKGKGKEVDHSAKKVVEQEEEGDDSSVEDWTVDDWDASPPPAGPSRLPSPTTGKRKSPETLGLAQLSLGSPRASSSQSADLPSPRSPSSSALLSDLSASGSALQLVRGATSQDTSKQRDRSGSVGGTRNKLIKRHPSASFVPLSSSASTDTLAKVPPLPASRSSYDVSRHDDLPRVIHRAKSGEQMPPPPLPPFLTASKPHIRARTSSRPTSRQGEVRVSAIPLSPSNEPNRRVSHGKRPSLWKRWSGQHFMGEPKTAPGTYIQDSIRIQRSRSSSIGGRKVSEEAQDHPPVPPLPLNFRSPRANSNMSSSSAASSSSNKSGPTRALSIIRRSASSLSRKSDHTTPPSAYTQANRQGGRSSTSINTPTEEIFTATSGSSRDILQSPADPAPHPFSPGFHLPSPTAGSPYRLSTTSPFSPPPLPHSTSFPAGLTKDDSDEDTETDELDRTPRRKKIRPVSALPAPRSAIKGWNGEGWKGFSGQGLSNPKRPETLPIGQRSTSAESSVLPPARTTSPRTTTFASSTASTLRRLGSMSKKHGRRLSGGFRFGPGPSTAEPRSPTSLTPVAGSPSKPSQPNYHDDDDDCPDETPRNDRGTSVSAPTSRMRNVQLSSSKISGPRNSDTHRRRQSDTDIKFSLAIPASVLAKQEGFKKGNSALKQFANGLKPLRSLLDLHAEAQRKAMSTGNAADLTMFEQLEQEYDQYFEMATVLIELGNTSQGMTTSNRASSDSADRQASLRSRRITLSADEARTAGDSLRAAFGNMPSDGTPVSQRHGSAPDPSSHLMAPFSPPRATPEHWRGSTGRQDLSKRQLEVLRSMLSTPVSERPGLAHRQNSTSTTNSIPTKTVIATATMRQISRSTASDRSVSGGVTGSPASSTYIIPSGSFPSPGTAADLANVKRTSRAGLAGLKEFLRTMKAKPDGQQAISPPSSPSMRLRYPQTASAAHFADASLDSFAAPSTGLSSKQHKRPSIRNSFRSSSGNWSDLVRHDKRQESGSSTSSSGFLPRLPSRSNLNQSGLGRKISQKRKKEDAPPLPPLITTSTEEKTIRPGRKSRIIGLGWPEMDDPSYSPSSSSTPPRPGPTRRSTTSDKEPHANGYRHEKALTEGSNWSDFPRSSADADAEEEITVAVTPDKLPFLLDYVRTCEKMLKEWKVRMEAVQVKAG